MRTRMTPFLALGLWLMVSSVLGNADLVSLKYTYKPDQADTVMLRDRAGREYLPLLEVAKFYGVQIQFDSQTRRVTLSKADNQAKLVVSQSDFLITNPTETIPMEPVEVANGQLGIPPMAAQDLFSALLGIQVRYLSDERALVAGGVKFADVRNEILAQEEKDANQPSQPAARAAVAKQSLYATAVPSDEGEEGADDTVRSARPDQPTPNSKKIYRLGCVVIDAGHGGKDIGARGYDRRYNEKQATLSIAKKVVALLKKEPELKVLMTRDSDYFVTLKGRTTFANKHGADLFVSIHCNSNPRSKASGTETYVYSPKASNAYGARVAHLENGGKDYTDFILNDLHHNNYKLRSVYLAKEVDGRIRQRLGQHLRGIQHAPFYVLARVDMPSILIETAFISNKAEEAKLRDEEWQDKIAKAIADGILSYRNVVESGLGTEQARR